MSGRYRIHEIFRSLQGEGALTGTPMAFIRFAGCNLWSGQESDRQSAACSFCDTDFSPSESLDEDELVRRVAAQAGPDWICLTGGEPTLQLERSLLQRLRDQGWRLALETNGTRLIDGYRDLLDWVCVSPKTGELRVVEGDELKLVYRGQAPEQLAHLAQLPFRYHFLQPEWSERYATHLEQALVFLQGQRHWRLSLQAHKLIGIR